MKKWAVFFISLLALKAEAATPFSLAIKWGFEKQFLQTGTGVAERLYAGELLYALTSAQRLKLEVGHWGGPRQEGREAAWQVAFSWGYRVQLRSGFFGEVFIGPAWISQTDSRLGSHPQLLHNINLGFQSEAGWSIGGGYGHTSNGNTLPGPNLGRDFFVFRFGIPLG